jgi:exosortase A-associated hydrolase 1
MNSAEFSETPFVVDGSQGPLIGILARPTGRPASGVLIVAGQPQTRIGAHRMFVTMARELATLGIASFRFDCGGWGDSPGNPLPFEESSGDIVAAAIAFRAHVEPGLKLVVLGLCDGASAAILALEALNLNGVAVDGLCLVNPWVREEKNHAEALLRTYYARRLLDPRTWQRLLTGKILPRAVLAPVRYWMTSRRWNRNITRSEKAVAPVGGLPERLLRAIQRHRGPIWTILSGNDLTAAEAETLLRADLRWRQALEAPPKRLVLRVAGADHTLTAPAHWNEATSWLIQNCRTL